MTTQSFQMPNYFFLARLDLDLKYKITLRKSIRTGDTNQNTVRAVNRNVFNFSNA